MINQSHTPLEWQAEAEHDGRYTIWGDCNSDNKHSIASVYPHWSGRQGQDAEFIVRACNAHEELIEVLEQLLEAMPALRDCEGNQPLAYIEDARAALEKAKGNEQ